MTAQDALDEKSMGRPQWLVLAQVTGPKRPCAVAWGVSRHSSVFAEMVVEGSDGDATDLRALYPR